MPPPPTLSLPLSFSFASGALLAPPPLVLRQRPHRGPRHFERHRSQGCGRSARQTSRCLHPVHRKGLVAPRPAGGGGGEH